MIQFRRLTTSPPHPRPTFLVLFFIIAIPLNRGWTKSQRRNLTPTYIPLNHRCPPPPYNFFFSSADVRLYYIC